MTTQAFAPSASWDLEPLYPGGSVGAAIRDRVGQVKAAFSRLLQTFEDLGDGDEPGRIDTLARALLDLEQLHDQLHDIESFAHCAASANTDDTAAKQLLATSAELESVKNCIGVHLKSRLAAMSPGLFNLLVRRPDLEHMRFFLLEMRSLAEIMMKPELEALQEELARDGFHGWSRLYDDVSGQLRVPVDRGQGEEPLSVEQARNLLHSTDGPFRERVAQAIHRTWDSQKEVFAAILNHINGYRQVLYRRRDIDELEIPLRLNRISRRTLDTLMQVVSDFRPVMARYLQVKARMLGMDRLRWFDIAVPLGSLTEKIPYEEAQLFIVRHFDGFSAELGEFARMAFRKRWVEAEDRAGKRHGGCCAGFPMAKESRIFMTYGQTSSSVQTLAHELGHAYHGWVLKDLPGRQRMYPATLAETASTFAESIVREAAYDQATDGEVKRSLLDRKLADAVSFIMNLPARFHFERAMYKERAEGELSPERLTQLIEDSFDQAYHGAISQHEQLFWASKLHFHLTSLPFYNFPYIVGYLFSLGLFARAMEQGPSFAQAYRETLRLTGFHTVEEVASSALGVDLQQPDFWQSALDMIARDVEEFESLA